MSVACSDRPVKGAIGFEIFIDAGLDLNTATSVKIKYRKPDKTTTGEWTASAFSKEVDGETAYGARYVTTTANDLDQDGTWELQVSVVMPGFTGAGQIAKLKVLESISVA